MSELLDLAMRKHHSDFAIEPCALKLKHEEGSLDQYPAYIVLKTCDDSTKAGSQLVYCSPDLNEPYGEGQGRGPARAIEIHPPRHCRCEKDDDGYVLDSLEIRKLVEVSNQTVIDKDMSKMLSEMGSRHSTPVLLQVLNYHRTMIV